MCYCPNVSLLRLGIAATLLVDGTRIDGGPPLSTLHGRFAADRGLVLSAVIPG
jgi:hypothetical protein